MIHPTMTIRAPRNVQEALTEAADTQGLTRNALVLVILREWLQNREKEAVKNER